MPLTAYSVRNGGFRAGFLAPEQSPRFSGLPGTPSHRDRLPFRSSNAYMSAIRAESAGKTTLTEALRCQISGSARVDILRKITRAHMAVIAPRFCSISGIRALYVG
jgi:hypothetical protein